MTNHSAKPEVDEGQPLKLPPDSYLKTGTMHIFIKASVAHGVVVSSVVVLKLISCLLPLLPIYYI